MRRGPRGSLFLSVPGLFLVACGISVGQSRDPKRAGGDQTATQATSLLRAKCLTCHNDSVRSGSINLATRETALATHAFAPGKTANSKLVQVVRAGRMPPTGKLTDAEIDLLARWITAGADWPEAAKGEDGRRKTEDGIGKSALNQQPAAGNQQPLWSLQPVRLPAVPRSPFDALAANPIDRFVFTRMAAKGLRPSPLADKRALLRRVSIDLTGLPPTLADIDAFLKDNSPDAYAKVVDRLLASPAYGERWGRHWLDVVRYGESNGYEQNHLRPNAWRYRDYVIRAFNEDRPYPRFIAEQLAGDALAPHDPDTNAATGFLVAGIHDTVGIQTDEGTRQQRANDLDDMVSTTGAAFLGLSVGCARCHDHKFDPIPQKDYYRLAACFAGVRHGDRALPVPSEPADTPRRAAALNGEIQALANEINALDSEAREKVLRERGDPVTSRLAVTARRNVDDFVPVTARFVRFTILATNDGAEPCLDELQIFGADDKQNLALAQSGAKASASSLLPGFAVHQIKHLNDGQFGNEWSWISATRGTGWAQIELARPALVQRVVWSRDGGAIPRFDDRLPTQYRIEVSLDGTTWEAVSTQAGRRGSSDYVHPDTLLKALTSAQRARRETLVARRAAAEQELARLNARDMAYAGQFATPDPIFLLNRGDVMQRVAPVTPGSLSCLPLLNPDLELASGASEPERRLALARWIGDPRNPLTARVLVNRVWQFHFGRGLVSTPSDFGRNGVPPSHPELLDWLAAVFQQEAGNAGRATQAADSAKLAGIAPQAQERAQQAAPRSLTINKQQTTTACGWSLKKLHKLLVMSYVYRQASDANAKGMATDAGNQLLWRMPLRRMEAEAIRDSILQTGGKLDRHMGGPSFPLFKYRVVNVAIYEPQENYGPETWRRSVYQQAARGIQDEVLSAFDCPESSQRAPRREATTTALQALNLLNGPFMQQQAGFLADRVRAEAGADAVTQIERAFRLTFGRPPDSSEQKAALSLVTSQGLAPLCRALMNANEFLYY